MESTTKVRRAIPADAAEIAIIYNQAIGERIATFETELRTKEERLRWLQQEHNEKHPVLVATLNSEIAGWGSISLYRPRSCYSGVGEIALYVRVNCRGKGIGKILLASLIEEASRLGYWKIVGRIFAFNRVSRNLCKQQGFREVGVYEKHAKLDGKWIDTVIVERLIPENLT